MAGTTRAGFFDSIFWVLCSVSYVMGPSLWEPVFPEKAELKADLSVGRSLGSDLREHLE